MLEGNHARYYGLEHAACSFMGCVMRLAQRLWVLGDTFLGLRHRKDDVVSESSLLEESAGARPHIAQGLPIAQGPP